jgi:Icc-related predicted phosphoesterase
MKLIIYSDIHLERQRFTPGLAAQFADAVVLAGDIGEGTDGLVWARSAFPDKPIVMVLGNHEFFGGQDFDACVVEAKCKAAELDIHLLECGEVAIGGVRFLGATLWTDFELFGPDADGLQWLNQEAQASIKDYSSGQIKVTPEAGSGRGSSDSLTPEATIQRHWASRKWLEEALAAGDPAKTVVVTHHCPNKQSIPSQFRTGDASKFSPVYASDLSYLGGRAALWIHGHVHESCNYDMQGTRVVCNPMGYCSKELGPQNPAFTDLLIEL